MKRECVLAPAPYKAEPEAMSMFEVCGERNARILECRERENEEGKEEGLTVVQDY
jgi:hypothetical protein